MLRNVLKILFHWAFSNIHSFKWFLDHTDQWWIHKQKLTYFFKISNIGYIDRVRQLQQDNHRLTKQVKVFESNQVTEINNMKDMYNSQVDDLKVMLDNMNKKYNQLKISSEGLLQENDDMKKKLNKKDFDAVANNEQINRLEDEMRQLANQLSLVETEKHKLHNQLQVSFILMIFTFLI